MSEAQPGGEGGRFSDLKVRLASALLMSAAAIGLTMWSPLSFAVLVLVLSVAMSWEWGRIVRASEFDAAFLVHAAAVVVAVAIAAWNFPALGPVALLVGALVLLTLVPEGSKIMSSLGVLYVGLPAVALIGLRSDGHYGLSAVFFLLIVVWTTDTVAFLAGRLVGGPKLWPRVSPKKTWSGFLFGVSGAACAAALFALTMPEASPGRLAVIGLGLGIIAQCGDLLESGLKRHYGVKDASQLIPGHGGVLDRVDGVVAAAVAAVLIGLLIGTASPARSLLIGA